MENIKHFVEEQTHLERTAAQSVVLKQRTKLGSKARRGEVNKAFDEPELDFEELATSKALKKSVPELGI